MTRTNQRTWARDTSSPGRNVTLIARVEVRSECGHPVMTGPTALERVGVVAPEDRGSTGHGKGILVTGPTLIPQPVRPMRPVIPSATAEAVIQVTKRMYCSPP